MTLQSKGQFRDVAFEIRTVTLLLVQGPDEPSAKNIRACLNTALISEYEMPLESLMKDFSMVMDGAAVMARVANSSVSREIQETDETWMSCLAHFLNNTMKSVLANTKGSSVLQVVVQDFRSIKRIIEDANRSGWDHSSSEGCKLKQESETRFGTFYQVAVCFLKSESHIASIVDGQNGTAVQAAYRSLKKTSNINGNVIGYPGIDAIFDAFGITADYIERFETALRPTLHIALPTIHRMLQSWKIL